MNTRVVACIAAALFALPRLASSEWIVDTGAPVQQCGGCGQSSAELRAAKFTIDGAVQVDAIQHLVRVPISTPVEFRVRADDNGMPGEALFTIETTLLPTYEFDWVGVGGLNWALTAGTYWVTMEDRDSDPEHYSPFVRMLGTSVETFPAQPMVAEAVGFAPDLDTWQVAIGKSGWRVVGTKEANAP